MTGAASRGWRKSWRPSSGFRSRIWMICIGYSVSQVSVHAISVVNSSLKPQATPRGSWKGYTVQFSSRSSPRDNIDLARFSDDECASNLMRQGQTDGGPWEQFKDLLAYTRGCRLRKNHLNSFEAHHWFDEQHNEQKYRLTNRSEVANFLVGLR